MELHNAKPIYSRALPGQSWVLKIFVLLFCLFMTAPLVVVLGAALEPQELLRFPPHGLSFRWFEAILNNGVILSSALNSAIIAFQATIIALILGVPAAYGLARSRPVPSVSMVLMAPLLIPELIIGMSILQGLSILGISRSLLTLTVAHGLICIPYVARIVQAAIAGTNPSIEEAATNLGASRVQVYLHVVIPMVAPAIAAVALFSFLVSFDNAVISLFLASAQATTLPITMYNYVQFNLDPGIAAVASLLMILSVVILSITYRFISFKSV